MSATGTEDGGGGHATIDGVDAKIEGGNAKIEGGSAPIDVVMNGEPVSLAAGLTLASWLESVGRDARTVAIEHNGAIVPRSDYAATAIEAGDRLEIVHFVQGG